MAYVKRLIEVDLPIRTISEHARKEKNMRKNHPWHLHIWWARRPWGACRAVTLASILPAPIDPECPAEFIDKAAEILTEIAIKPKSLKPEDVQNALLRFVGVYSKWESGSKIAFTRASRRLIEIASRGEKHVVFDNFAGYGAIPAEAARLGCESIASELNPVALTCLKTVLEDAPHYGNKLIDLYERGSEFLLHESHERLKTCYPDHDGKTPIAWLWARTVHCEGPGCGAEIPLISQTVIAKGSPKTWIEITGDSDSKNIDIRIKTGQNIPRDLVKTAGGGHAVCPVCGFTTNKEKVKQQSKAGQMGHRLFGVALAKGTRAGKEYINSRDIDLEAYQESCKVLEQDFDDSFDEKFPSHDPRAFTAGLYGIKSWGDLFSPRQKVAFHTFGKVLDDYRTTLEQEGVDDILRNAVIRALSLSVSNIVHYNTNMSTWLAEHVISAFITGNAIAMRWDWAEANPLVQGYAGGLDYSLTQGLGALKASTEIGNESTVLNANAFELPLPDDSADFYFSDPPYYDVVPYADLSDLCYIWLKRYLRDSPGKLFANDLSPKKEQIVVNPYGVEDGRGDQSPGFYQQRMTAAFADARRVLKPDGTGAVVFAHKGTDAWETLLASILDAGFIITASWPIDTERGARMRANKSAVLGSSVHLIVRPRENADGSVRTGDVGEWKNVLSELPERMNNWLSRLVNEGIVGADAIFACLGPALEIFSRYSFVEKPNGEKVELSEYLERVWAAISHEALNMIFQGADARGFEEDARLTAMWLWTLKNPSNNGNSTQETKSITGYTIEYDAARKIAMGLGVHLERLDHLVNIKGNKAMLLSAAARTKHLFGKDSGEKSRRRRKKSPQMAFDFDGTVKELEQEADDWAGDVSGRVGTTVLDQLHQSMILFGAGRGQALRRFLVEEGVGQNAMFWKLAQALSALYPPNSEEKRWVDGVLARKKGLGF